jgi:glycerophosphoryl diester phosphodiesterase
VPDRAATPALLERAGELGLERIPFTVDDPARAAELVALGAEGIFTNRPAVMRAVVGPPGPVHSAA